VLQQIAVVFDDVSISQQETKMLVTNCHPTRLLIPKDSNIYVHVREKFLYHIWKQLLNK